MRVDQTLPTNTDHESNTTSMFPGDTARSVLRDHLAVNLAVKPGMLVDNLTGETVNLN